MPYIESLDEFKDRMGCEYIRVRRGENFRTGDDAYTYRFANGAVSDGHLHRDPPTDPKQLLTMRRDYLKALLDREERDFKTYKARVLNQASMHASHPEHCPPAPPNAATVLRESHARMEGWRVELAHLDEQLVDSATRAREAFQRQQQAQQQGRAALALHEIKSVNV